MAEKFIHNFPQYLHKPLQIMWFEMDEFIIFIFGFIVCLMIAKSWIYWLFFPAFLYGYIKIKRKNARGFLKHYLFMLGFVKMEQYPDYFEKEFSE